MKINVMRCLLPLILLLSSGCGYHLPSVGGSPFPGDGNTIKIEPFANRAFKANLESLLANELIDEFGKRGNLVIVTDGNAALVLSGAIASYGISAISYSSVDTVKEYRATMTLDATLRQKSDQKVLWKGNASYSQDFPASANIAFQQNSEDAAIQEISRRICQQLYMKITEDF